MMLGVREGEGTTDGVEDTASGAALSDLPPPPTRGTPVRIARVAAAIGVTGAVGLLIGAGVTRATDWVNGASRAPDQYEPLGRGLVAIAVGTPVVVVVALLTFRVVRL